MKNIVPSIVGEDGQLYRHLSFHWTREDGSLQMVGIDFRANEHSHVDRKTFAAALEEIADYIRNHP